MSPTTNSVYNGAMVLHLCIIGEAGTEKISMGTQKLGEISKEE